MKAKSVFIGIAAAAIVLLLLSITAVSRVLSASPGNLLRDATVQPIAATFLPKRSPLVASFLVNPDKLGLSAKLAAPPGDRAALRREIDDLKRLVKQEWALDYDADVKPWLGNEVTFAVTTTDLDRQPENGLQPGYLLALEIDKPGVAKKSVEAFWQKQAIAGIDLAFEQYQGVPFIYATPTSKRPGLTAGILGKFVLLTNDPKAMRNAINDIQVPDLALASFNNYKKSVGQLSEARVGVAFVNLAELGKWGAGSGSIPSNLANLPEAAITLGLGLDRLGVKAETLLTLDSLANLPAIAASTSSATDNKATQSIPVGSSVIVGRDLQQTWQQINAAVQPYPELTALLDRTIALVSSHLGFSLEQDISAWVRGEYAISLQPQADRANDWVFAVQKTNPEIAKTAIAQLDDSARSKSKLTVGELEVDGRELTVWTRLSAAIGKADKKVSSPAAITGTVAAVRSQTPDLVLVANSVDAMEAALTANPKSSDYKSNAKAIAATLPRNYQTYAYLNEKLDLAALLADVPGLKQMSDRITKSKLPIVDRIKAITIASASSNTKDSPNVRRGQIFLVLE
ncbi:DUF3352 domain-containing protein [Pseudanabaena sp. PCC 6802]|uniref:DUF3352 domain-containing protein n=1 Tax=Pseudanabaena sp. PCC 6802 TaxID=118173 RepID=UPI00034C0D23|nr:DUF3352 domain-containing protein [Pseudanabaena sp. PCC 6802]